MRLQVSKLDAARRQLETAVELYFENGDPIAMNSLAAAGGELLQGISATRGSKVSVGVEGVLDYVKPEHIDEVRRLLKESQNFCKHADRDPEGVLEFETGEAEARLLDACQAYRLLAPAPALALQVYELYAALTWANHFVVEGILDAFPAESRRKWTQMSRPDFYHELLALLGDSSCTPRDAGPALC